MKRNHPGVLLGLLFLSGCSQKSGKLFDQLGPAETGIDFVNTIRETDDANVLNYAYFYNGGGVAIGDINNETGFISTSAASNSKILRKAAASPPHRAGVPALRWRM